MKTLKIKNCSVLLDDEDYVKLSVFKWHINNKYCARTCYIDGKKIERYMHRDITDAKIGIDIDHINGNKLDNRKCNLRMATRSQNMLNTPCHRDNKTGYKGVHFYKENGKFTARIKVGGLDFFLGYFKTSKEAALAYNKKAIEVDRDFCFLNVV